MGCDRPKATQPENPIPEATPEIFNPPPGASSKAKRQRFELTVTLSDLSELKVGENQTVTKGQTVSEKRPTEQQLLNREKLKSQIAEKKSFAEEDQLRQAIASLEAAKQILANFDRTSPFKGIDEAYIPISRTLERNKLVAAVQQAAVTVEASKALVQEARRRAVTEQNLLVQQLNVIESELEKLKVRSPYSGTIRRLKIEKGTNSEIVAKLRIISEDGKPNRNISKASDEEVSQTN